MPNTPAPFSYFGGKARMLKYLTPLMPAPMTFKRYVEPFAGSATLLFAVKQWAANEVINDVNGNVVAFFKALRDEPNELIRRLSLTPKSRQECNQALELLQSPNGLEDVERARLFYVSVMQSFARKMGSYAPATSNREFPNAVDKLYKMAQRLRRVEIECYPYQKVLKIYDNTDTMFYCDPPYLNTRVEMPNYYACRMLTIKEHAELLDTLLDCKAGVILSGFRNSLYNSVLIGWKSYDVPLLSITNSGKGQGSQLNKPRQVETIWVNPHAQQMAIQKQLF